MALFKSTKKQEADNILREADTPIPFGYKISWLAIKADNPENVMDKLGCTDRKVSNWKSAFEVMYNSGQVFVTPCLDGYVLILNYDKPVNDIDMKRLQELAAQFACMKGDKGMVQLLISGNSEFDIEKKNDAGYPILIQLIRKKASNAIIEYIMYEHDPVRLFELTDGERHNVEYWAKRMKNETVKRTLENIKKDNDL